MVKKELTRRNESVINKNDLVFNISAATGEGFDAFWTSWPAKPRSFLAGAESALVTRERHRHALEEALAALRRAQSAEVAAKEDLLAEELRHRRPRARPPHRPGRCRGYSGRDLPRLLHRQIAGPDKVPQPADVLAPRRREDRSLQPSSARTRQHLAQEGRVLRYPDTSGRMFHVKHSGKSGCF